MSTCHDTLPVRRDAAGLRDHLAALTTFFGAALGRVRSRAALRERRRAFLTVATLDDRMLDDIGLKRSDVERARALPLEMNASLAVRQFAAERRAGERRFRRR